MELKMNGLIARRLPLEIHMEIIGYLDPKTLLKYSAVCTETADLILNAPVWKTSEAQLASLREPPSHQIQLPSPAARMHCLSSHKMLSSKNTILIIEAYADLGGVACSLLLGYAGIKWLELQLGQDLPMFQAIILVAALMFRVIHVTIKHCGNAARKHCGNNIQRKTKSAEIILLREPNRTFSPVRYVGRSQCWRAYNLSVALDRTLTVQSSRPSDEELSILDNLLESAPLNMPDANGSTPLTRILKTKHQFTIRALVSKGANVTAEHVRQAYNHDNPETLHSLLHSFKKEVRENLIGTLDAQDLYSVILTAQKNKEKNYTRLMIMLGNASDRTRITWMNTIPDEQTSTLLELLHTLLTVPIPHNYLYGGMSLDKWIAWGNKNAVPNINSLNGTTT